MNTPTTTSRPGASVTAPVTPSIIRRAILRTRDAAPLAKFYEMLLGLRVERDSADDPITNLRHPASGETLLTLLEDRNAKPAMRHAPGLFHIAFLFPELEDWKNALRQMFTQPHLDFHGASDHGVSWAVYLADPDGNGIELAWDKPEQEWPWKGDRIQMVSLPLPLRSILAQPAPWPASQLHSAAVHIGHLHLQSSQLEDAKAYLKHLNLRVTQDSYSGAVFMARGHYHHHLAVNTWNTRPGASRPARATGLVGWDMVVPGADDGTIWVDPAGSEVKLSSN